MKSKNLIVISIFYVALLLVACRNANNKNRKTEPQNSYESVADTNSSKRINNLEEIKIGKQTWAIENLDVSNFRNGDAIPEAKTDEEWKKAGNEGNPAWCFYDNNPENGKKYGKLYNWYAVNDPRGLAPAGCHIPSDAEWTKLTDYLGGAYDGADKKMKATNGWYNSGNGTNESGFAGLPGGSRDPNKSFNVGKPGTIGTWWSSTESEDETLMAWSRSLAFSGGVVFEVFYHMVYGFSVRCLRD